MITLTEADLDRLGAEIAALKQDLVTMHRWKDERAESAKAWEADTNRWRNLWKQLRTDYDALARKMPRMEEALRDALTDLSNTRSNVMLDLAKGNDRWEGVPDLMKARIEKYRAALSEPGA